MYTLETMPQFVGKELGVSDWFHIDQERINQFAQVTGDHQWIHIDPERAAKESPFGTTIAHGYLTLALLPMLAQNIQLVPSAGVSQVFNYGIDKLRFMAPVKVGARVRNRVKLVSVEPRGEGRLLLKTENTVEIEGEDKPALVAETLAMMVLA